MIKIFIILIFIMMFSSCKPIKCECNNPKCGIECRNKCEGNRCFPGVPCCDKCICNRLENIKL
jgi:hypothetical protein